MKSANVIRAVACGILASFMLSTAAWALTLNEARDKGLVAEKLNGYVAAVEKRPDVVALVDSVNDKRKDEYRRIANENGQTIDVVSRLASKQIIQSLQPGHLYEDAGGFGKKR